jgi:hypothetical protein
VKRRLPTGRSESDASDAFDQARSREVLARLGRWVRRQPSDVNAILSFDEVVRAAGRVGERERGLRTIPLDAVVGTVDRDRGPFDRSFRPRSSDPRQRWVRLAASLQRGEAMEPISAYQVGDAYFVRDGHHRVSVARAAGLTTIQAIVTEVLTTTGASADLRLTDLPVKTHERYFLERVPLGPQERARVVLDDPARYAPLAEGVEAWGFRVMQERGVLMSRAEVAEAWFREEYLPAVTMLSDTGLLPEGAGETESYMRLAEARYNLVKTHRWDESVVRQLAQKLRGKPRRSSG